MSEVRPNGLQVFRFSTTSYRPHERIAAWREMFGRVLLNIDIAPQSREGFQANATAFRSPSFGLIDVSTSAAYQSNSRSLITSDDVSFGATNARWGASQLGRSTELQPGDGLLMSNGDVGAITFPSECRYFAFCIPRSAIEPLVPDVGSLFARRTPASNPAFQMLLRYLKLAQNENGVVTTPELELAFTNHVCDLLALALGPTRDAAELARTRGLYTARLLAIKQDIRRSIGRPNLSVHSIAARHGVSVRYVQKLFEESGCTFTRYVSEQRLTAAHKALVMRADAPINTIIYDLGFTDISNFNRAFRRRFGCTPTDVRNAAKR
jgi:AraC-like DNA-binding protein